MALPTFAAHAAGRLLNRNCSQRIAPRIRRWAHDRVLANVSDSRTTHPARTGLKFRSSLFKGLRVKGRALVALRRERNSPAFCFGKKEAWRKSPFSKGQLSPFQVASAKRIPLFYDSLFRPLPRLSRRLACPFCACRICMSFLHV